MNTVPTGEVVEKAVLLAGRAPSLHNSQPWRWVFDGQALHLFSVPDRMLPATDVSGRQMIISCGIALDHLHAALAAVGWRTSIAYFPNPNQRDHLATVRFIPALVVTDADRDRAEAIVRRRTDRQPFAPPAGWSDFDVVLRSTFDPANTALDVLTDESRPELAQASELTASLRRYDSGYQAELQWWTGHVIGAAGVPREALISPAERERVTVARKFPAAADKPNSPEPALDRSTILVLSTDDDSPRSVLRCGQVLSTVLLECTLAGYATCPLTHVTETLRARSIIARLTGRHAPQVLIRVGAASQSNSDTAPTPRLPLADILTFDRLGTGNRVHD